MSNENLVDRKLCISDLAVSKSETEVV